MIKTHIILTMAVIFIGVVYFTGCSHGTIQEVYWESHNSVAFDEERKGNIAEAETTFKVALGRAVQLEDEEKIAISQHNLGAFYRRQNRVHDAIPYLKLALVGKEKVFGQASKETGTTLAQLAASYATEGNYFEGRQYADRLKPLAKYYSGAQALFVEKVLGAYVIDTEKYNKKVAELKPLADSGDPKAQYQLASEYFDGPYAKELLPEILTLYEKAAAQGFIEAQYYLGVLYDKGRGVRNDDKKARAYYKMAAENNDVRAQFNYATFLLKGRGGPRNEKEAWEWISKSSARGFPPAQRLLLKHTY